MIQHCLSHLSAQKYNPLNNKTKNNKDHYLTLLPSPLEGGGGEEGDSQIFSALPEVVCKEGRRREEEGGVAKKSVRI